MSVTPLGIVISPRVSHSLNVPSRITEIEGGRVIFSSEEHPANAYSPISLHLEFWVNIICFIFLLSKKAKGGISRMSSGILIMESPSITHDNEENEGCCNVDLASAHKVLKSRKSIDADKS